MEAFEELLANSNKRTGDARSHGLYIGIVMANNDPQQMKRCRVQVLGIDQGGHEPEYYRWAQTVSSIGGIQNDVPMGPAKEITEGLTSYGQFAVPKIGATVLVSYIGGRLSNPVIIGSLQGNNLISGLPGGNLAQNEIDRDNTKHYITRLWNRLKTAFGGSSAIDTRGYEVTGRAEGQVSGVPDVNEDKRKDGDIIADRSKTGYPKTTGQGDTPEGTANEPMMYSFTSPGQHTILMNDDPDNCRIRIRTLSGNQVILDDTNERIYISSGKGNNYIEMDEDGHVDIYSSWRINLHAENDINIKSDKQVNIEGLEGVNIVSPKDIKVHTESSLSVKVDKNTYIETAQNTNIKSGANAMYQAGGTTNILSGGNHIETATEIHMNGPTAAPASGAVAANKSNRNPLHETNDGWRAISSTGSRNDKANMAHNDKSPEDPYENLSSGGKNSQKRLDNWRP